jgi:hypothetical protein
MVVVDNPMLPGTGTASANDCMKGCTLPKQEPSTIPQAETGVLTGRAGLPWASEIYGCLTRWNPLNPRAPVRRLPYRGPQRARSSARARRVYTLLPAPAQRRLRRRRRTTASRSSPCAPTAGRDVLARRAPCSAGPTGRAAGRAPLAGFGGVAEYGITVRWDKSFLGRLT